MRRQIRVFVFVVLVGICAVPLAASTPSADTARDTSARATGVVERAQVPASGVRDEAAMVLVGTMLIGVAAAVRRAA